MSSTVPGPSSSYRYSCFPIPTPCSPVPTPFRPYVSRRCKEVKECYIHVPSNAIARLTILLTTSRAICNSSSFRNSRSAWKLPSWCQNYQPLPRSENSPSPTCPTMVDTRFTDSRSFFVSYTSCGSLDTGTLYHTATEYANAVRTPATELAKGRGSPHISRPPTTSLHKSQSRI
jgi:hypothetical protein